jgi:hypothetical protein
MGLTPQRLVPHPRARVRARVSNFGPCVLGGLTAKAQKGIKQGQEDVAAPFPVFLMLAAHSTRPEIQNPEPSKIPPQTVKMAVARRDFVMGFICTSRLSEDSGMIHMTPGKDMISCTAGFRV